MSGTISQSAELIAGALVAENVSTVFGITGSHVVDIFEALYRQPSISIVAARHEGGASFMAAAFARVIGKTGVCVTTAGPGVLNAMNGLAQARFSALPVVCISGGVPLDAPRYDLHGLEQELYCVDAIRPLVKESIRATAVSTLSGDIARAFQIAASGRRGPVYLEIPWNLFDGSMGAGDLAYVAGEVQPARFNPSDAKIVATSLNAAKSPLLVLDKGVLGSGVAVLLGDIATRLNCPIVVTRDALGAVPDDHPCYAGVLHDHQFGSFAFDALKNCDCCVAVGFDAASQNERLVDRHCSQAVIYFASQGWDTDSPVDVVSMRELIDELSQAVVVDNGAHDNLSMASRARGESVDQMRMGLANYQHHQPIHFGYALTALVPYLSGDTITVLDAGSHEVWARSVLPLKNELSLIGGNDWASMGFAIPATVGARAATPSRRLVCITGDGCLLMSFADLSTLIEAGGPTVIINLNDSEYGMMSQVQKTKYGVALGTTLPTIDYAAVAAELGAETARVENPGDIKHIFAKAFASDTPFFIDLICESGSGYPVYEKSV